MLYACMSMAYVYVCKLCQWNWHWKWNQYINPFSCIILNCASDWRTTSNRSPRPSKEWIGGVITVNVIRIMVGYIGWAAGGPCTPAHLILNRLSNLRVPNLNGGLTPICIRPSPSNPSLPFSILDPPPSFPPTLLAAALPHSPPVAATPPPYPP